MDAPVEINTDRLRLKKLESRHAARFFSDWGSDPHATAFAHWPTHCRAEQTQSFIAQIEKLWLEEGIGPYLITAGYNPCPVGYLDVRKTSDDELQIYYVIMATENAFRYQDEILEGITSVASMLGYTILKAIVHPEDTSFTRVLEQAGFEHKGATDFRFPNYAGNSDVDALVHVRSLA